MDSAAIRSAKSAVIAILLQHRLLSRSELARFTGLSPAAITDVTQHFLEQGILVEQPVVPASKHRGRPSTLLSICGSHAYFLGLSVADIPTTIVIADLKGEIVAKCPLPASTTPEALISSVKTAYAKLLESQKVSRARIRGVGITVTGIIDHPEGICRYSAALDWQDVPIATMVGKALKLPAWMDNDANAIAVRERYFGLARDYQNFTNIVLGRTIGAAHFFHGALYRGHDGGAGEIGHITVDPNGAMCRCGRNGCLDTIAGSASLRAAAKRQGLKATGMRDLETLAVHGNVAAIQLLRTAGRALGATVAAIVQINNPQCILFTDTEGFENGVFRTATRQAIENSILPRFLTAIEILFKDVSPDFLPRSAAAIAAYEFLRSIE